MKLNPDQAHGSQDLGVRKVRKRILSKLIRGEKGQALIIVVILILLGALVIAPMLGYMATGIKVGKEVFENKMYEFYAADAGVEDALWYLQSDERLGAEFDPGYNPTDPNWTIDDIDWPIEYELTDPPDLINEKEVGVTIERVWILNGLLSLPDEMPDEGDADNGNNHWTVVGAINIDDTTNYIVDIVTDESGDALVDHIGVWLPQGYSYVDDSVKINGVAIGEDPLVTNPDDQLPHRGGTALIWDFWGTTFKDLSDITPPPPPGGGVTPAEKFPPSIRLSFDYTGNEAKGFFPWIELADDRIAWDTEAGIYHVESLATEPAAVEGTTVEAYVPRGLRRYTSGSGGPSSSIQGDYIAIGNSLMTECWNRYWVPGWGWVTSPGPPCNYSCEYNCRGKYFNESSATINAGAVPDDAEIEKAYLFWTAWWDTDGADTEAILEVDGNLVTPDDPPDPGDPPYPDGTVVADRYYVMPTPGSDGYQYACFADVTGQVREITTDVNSTMFTVGEVDAIPADTCAQSPLWRQATNAGWSMVIVYSSAEMDTHQIYLYDRLTYLWDYYGAAGEFTILGFEVPEGDSDAKLTVFAAEGDGWIDPDYVEFKGEHSGWTNLGDRYESDPNYWQNVFNGYSAATGFTPEELDGQPAGEISGVDIDTYTEDRYGTSLSAHVNEGDISAKIRVRTVGWGYGCDGIMLTYVVFSVRSNLVPAGEEFEVGTMTYEIK